jgi:hypothetical protein
LVVAIMRLHDLACLMFPLVPLVSLGACATEDSTSTDDQPLLGAPVDHHDAWDVGVCAGPLNTDPAAGPLGACLTEGTRCSGTLIAPDLVLTARHCVHELDYSNATGFCDGVFTTTPLTTSPVHITTSLSTIGTNPHWHIVDQILVPQTNLSCADDIAILRLRHVVPPQEARPIAVDTRELTTHKPAQVVVVGRGVIDETFDTDDYSQIDKNEAGLKRRILQHIPFVCVSNAPGVCSTPDIGGSFDVDPGYLVFGKSTASGDSGSGVIRQTSYSAGAPLLIGVTSAGTTDPVTGKPNFSFGTRVDRHAVFIHHALHGSYALANPFDNGN